jgi:hypothetical protein
MTKSEDDSLTKLAVATNYNLANVKTGFGRRSLELV